MTSSIGTPAPRRPGRPRKDESSSTARDGLLKATIDRIAAQGPTDANARDVCNDAGVTFAMVNYNFGSWNGLIAEAAAEVYVNYVEGLWVKVAAAEQNPESRLRAYLRAQLTWAMEMPGWGAIFNYPFSAKKATDILKEKFGHITTAYFELNLARLEQLTIDVRENKVTPFDYTTENFPREELLADRLGLARSTMVGWTSLGMMVWAGRGPALEAQIPEILELQGSIFEFAIEESISNIRGDLSR